ncbi:hypothetical protein K474DRAFT_1602622 [Panus rudis PR-1116 ss-1]|nr:hypothetical protein K474DRAFT_1602622 [Panus rudis PR-1116 ss-1]
MSTPASHPYAAYSSAEWKREPSTAEVVFGLELPYRPPKSFIGAYIWRWRMWFECTFALTMLEPWEKVFVIMILNATMLLLVTGIYFYLPPHLTFLRSRALYYLLGQDTYDFSMDSLQQFLTEWGWNSTATNMLTGTWGTARDL